MTTLFNKVFRDIMERSMGGRFVLDKAPRFCKIYFLFVMFVAGFIFDGSCGPSHLSHPEQFRFSLQTFARPDYRYQMKSQDADGKRVVVISLPGIDIARFKRDCCQHITPEQKEYLFLSSMPHGGGTEIVIHLQKDAVSAEAVQVRPLKLLKQLMLSIVPEGQAVQKRNQVYASLAQSGGSLLRA